LRRIAISFSCRPALLVGTPRARGAPDREQWSVALAKDPKDRSRSNSAARQKALRGGKSAGRQEKEMAMRRKKLARLLWALRGLRRETSRDRLLLRLARPSPKPDGPRRW